ncbi:MAG: hypothetical protein ACTSWN_14000 [Promethearchaeota archaeon]
MVINQMKLEAVLFGIIFGLIGSCTLNLGKSLQKQGIELFERQRMAGSKRARKGLIWIVGSSLSMIQPLFQTIGQTIGGASATVYSAMFGVGIAVVLFYSYKVLKESINRFEIIGTILIILGTVVFGIVSILDALDAGEDGGGDATSGGEREINWSNFMISMIFTAVAFVLISIYTLKTKRLWGVIFGLIGGSLGGLDNVFKSLSKSSAIEDWGTFSGFTSVFYYISFALGSGAFLLTNVGYSRGKAITVVPAYSAFYILMPMVIEGIIFLDMPNILQIVGVGICVVGVVLSTRFRILSSAGISAKGEVDAGQDVQGQKDDGMKEKVQE